MPQQNTMYTNKTYPLKNSPIKSNENKNLFSRHTQKNYSLLRKAPNTNENENNFEHKMAEFGEFLAPPTNSQGFKNIYKIIKVRKISQKCRNLIENFIKLTKLSLILLYNEDLYEKISLEKTDASHFRTL